MELNLTCAVRPRRAREAREPRLIGSRARELAQISTEHILLALAEGERHGYAIIQDVEARTGGALRMSAGTLYCSIARMVEQGLIVEVAKRQTRAEDERRRYYRVTPFGSGVTRAEVRRLEQFVRMARALGVRPAVS